MGEVKEYGHACCVTTSKKIEAARGSLTRKRHNRHTDATNRGARGRGRKSVTGHTKRRHTETHLRRRGKEGRKGDGRRICDARRTRSMEAVVVVGISAGAGRAGCEVPDTCTRAEAKPKKKRETTHAQALHHSHMHTCIVHAPCPGLQTPLLPLHRLLFFFCSPAKERSAVLRVVVLCCA